MLGFSTTIVILIVGLGVFAWVGLAVGRDRDLDEFAVARNSQNGLGLGLSFFASGVGAWILFAAPEVGATTGLAGVLGYAVAITVPLIGLVLVGRRLRSLVPEGHNLIEFVRLRYGRVMHVYVLAISMLYMLVALSAELTAVGAVLGRLSVVDPRLGIAAVAVITALYTAYGGLRASIRTDRWQSWMLFPLLILVGAILFAGLSREGAPVDPAFFTVDVAGVEAALTLIVAVTATTLFHNGYWQRVWAAQDERALSRGAIIGALTRFPVVLAAGMVGLLAAAYGVSLGVPPVPFFALMDFQPAWVLAAVLILTLALVASTVDTLQNGLAAVAVTHVPSMGLTGGRIATVVFTLIPALVAFQGFSVLRLFLIADLFCAATIVPALLGLWHRSTTAGAVSGALAGLAAALGYGFVVGGSLPAAIAVATFSEGLALPPFLAALSASAAVTILVSLAAGRSTDLAGLNSRVIPLPSPPEALLTTDEAPEESR
ncbi:sodium:solute symporter [Arthrobacter sp. H20]|uniref:sodium:solute symporter family transporter n=1 Tax=Arthrobacter sp. H20 TaxID=1267981 RepID=UPI0004B7863E|nr:sodium:solute symporter [Arthrobacter sp. H20]